jgi:hypothetical protein
MNKKSQLKAFESFTKITDMNDDIILLDKYNCGQEKDSMVIYARNSNDKEFIINLYARSWDNLVVERRYVHGSDRDVVRYTNPELEEISHTINMIIKDK